MRAPAWIVAATTALSTVGAHAGWPDTAGLELRFDDNVPKGQLSRDIKADTAVVASVAGGTGYQLTDSDRLILTLTLSATGYRRYGGLDNLNAGLEFGYRRKFGLGPLAPELRLAASATRLEYRDKWRDGWLYTGEIGLAKRMSERFGLRAAYQLEQRRSDDVAERLLPRMPADVFDLASRNVVLGADYTLDQDYVLSAAYTVRDGDIVSTTLRNLPVFLASDAIAADTVFGRDRFAYRLRGVTRGLNLGVGRLIGSQASLTLAYEYRDSRAEGGIDYEANIVRAIYLHQF